MKIKLRLMLTILSKSYWTSFSTDTLDKTCKISGTYSSDKTPLFVDFDVDEEHNTTVMTIVAQDHPGLFSRIAGAVAFSQITIANARINTRKDGTILDAFRIQDEDRQAVRDMQRYHG